MATNSDKSDMLFACTKCHRRCKFEDLSTSQQLCKSCRKQFPLVTCTYCRLEFHPIKSSSEGDSRPACDYCAREFKLHGVPSFCSVCNLQSAFTGKKCSRCSRSEKKYGPPISCEDCKLVCAFAKPDDVKQKVNGKSLCLLCTINYKKAQFKKKSLVEQKSSGNSTSSHSSATGTRYRRDKHSTLKHSSKHKDKDGEPTLKKLKLDRPSSTYSPPTVSHHLSLLRSNSSSMDSTLFSNHMLETDKLQNEISSLKKQLAQKEQTILDKDKQICQLRAEVAEKDRDLRTKLQDKQKNYSDSIETLQTEIRGLKKQLSQSTQKKTSSSTVSSQNSIIASLTSSLSAAPVNSSS